MDKINKLLSDENPMPFIKSFTQSLAISFEHLTTFIDRITWMKKVGHESWWWSYWNNQEFERSLQGGINHSTAKFLLWKYENHLESKGKSGYTPTRFDKIINPHLEHIAPETENPETGYDFYDEEFRNQYLNCLGNYLLLSQTHNIWASNRAFVEKRAEYNQLAQQREIQQMTETDLKWTRDKISERKLKIIQLILTEL